MTRRIVILFAFVMLASSARAILPPDAKAREPQLRAYRQRLTDNYEKRLVERQAEAVQAYDQTRVDIFTPPWLRTGSRIGSASGTDGGQAASVEKASKRNHRLLISIVLLILIGSVVGWVRYATRKLDE